MERGSRETEEDDLRKRGREEQRNGETEIKIGRE